MDERVSAEQSVALPDCTSSHLWRQQCLLPCSKTPIHIPVLSHITPAHTAPPHPVSLTSILISFYLRLGLCLLNPGFLNTSLCAFLFSPKSGTCSTLSCFLISSTYNISCGVKTKKILTKVSSSLLLNPSKALFSILISGALIPCYSLNVG